MKIVIEISKHIYEHAKEHIEDSNDEWYAMRAIAAGTQLPKGHGDLIDRKALLENAYTKEFCSWYDEIKMADTIIEEDTESEEKKNV